MKVLLTASTPGEIELTKDFLEKTNFQINQHEFAIVITGIGGIAATYGLLKSIQNERPGYVIQAGIAGSFDYKMPIGTTVCVTEEIIGDLGAEEDNQFRDLFDLGLVKESNPPFSGKTLKNPFIAGQRMYDLPVARSISINEITTRKDRIEYFRNKFNAEIESMEGAAFHYVCICEKIPFIQIRTVSNYVGERNKDKWKIPTALENLNSSLLGILRQL